MDCQDCINCGVDNDAHHSYLYCQKHIASIDKNTGYANKCSYFKRKKTFEVIDESNWIKNFNFITVDGYVVVTKQNGKIISAYPDRIKKLINVLKEIDSQLSNIANREGINNES